MKSTGFEDDEEYDDDEDDYRQQIDVSGLWVNIRDRPIYQFSDI